jgi:hypothetical protein
MNMKYFIISKCRLTDLNKYLLPDQIFTPKDDEYERTSRSLAAALRAGWVRKATVKEIESFEKNESIVQIRPKPSKTVILGAVEMTPESFADEVISGDDILKARDKRRAESTTKLPEVEVVIENSQQEEISQLENDAIENSQQEEISQSKQIETLDDDSDELDDSNEVESSEEESKNEEATGIKKEIEKKIEKKVRKLKKKKN